MDVDTRIKCRKCRTTITQVSSAKLLNAHSEQFSNDLDANNECSTVVGRTEVYLMEEAIEQWIQNEIEQSEWTKGKLKCTKCSSNVGSFDFVTGQKCDCRQFNQPPVHFIRSKVDVETIKWIKENCDSISTRNSTVVFRFSVGKPSIEDIGHKTTDWRIICILREAVVSLWQNAHLKASSVIFVFILLRFMDCLHWRLRTSKMIN